MKVATILLLGAVTLVAYASAHPYSKIPEVALHPDGYHFKKSSSNSNSNSYSQSNHDEADIGGVIGGQVFSGTRESGYNTNGGSSSHGSSYSSASFNGNIPFGIIAGSGIPDATQNPSSYNQIDLSVSNPGTAGLGLGDNGAGSFSYGFSNAGGSSGSSGNQVTEGTQAGFGSSGAYDGTAGIGSSSGLAAGSSGFNSGSHNSAGGVTFGQVLNPTSDSLAPSSGIISFDRVNSKPGEVQYWWNGPGSPFGLSGKPSGGCTSNLCTLSGSFDLSQGAGGAEASNSRGQTSLNINGGNPFFNGAVPNSGSGFITAGASFGQTNVDSGSFGSGSDSLSIDRSKNPFFSGSYTPNSVESSGSAGSVGSAGSFASSSGSFIGNPFLKPDSVFVQNPQVVTETSTALPGYGGSRNPFFKPGSGSVVVTPTVAVFSDQSPTSPSPIAGSNPFFNPTVSPGASTPGFLGQNDQVSSSFGSQSTVGFSPLPTPSGSNPFFSPVSTPGASISGSAGNAGTGDFQDQNNRVSSSFGSQSTLGFGSSTAAYPTPSTLSAEEESSDNQNGLTIDCSGEGRICVLTSQCVNGRVFTSQQGLTQIRSGPQQCQVNREVCCTLTGYSGVSTSGIGQGSSFASAGSSSTTNFGSSSGNYGDSSSSSIKPVKSGSTGSFGQSGQSTGSTGSSSLFGIPSSSSAYDELGQSGLSSTFGQFGQTGSSATVGQIGQSGSFGSSNQFDQTSGSFGASDKLGQTGSAVSSGIFGQTGSSGVRDQVFTQPGTFGISGQSGQYGSSNSYDQTQQKQSSNFGFTSTGQASASSSASSGSNVASGFTQKIPSGSSSGASATGLPRPTGFNYGGANSGGSSQTSSGTGTFTYTTPSLPNKGSFSGGKQPSTVETGLFGSSDNSGEDLSAGEPSFTGSSGGNQDAFASNGYLPPFGSEPSSNVPAFAKPPPIPKEGGQIRPLNADPIVKVPIPRPLEFAPVTVQVGCAAALICVEEQYCTLEGVISPQPVTLTKQQIERRAPLSSCRNADNGVIGKCCRDPNYVDPWPTGNLPANYSGGFDEQGFPTVWNITKTRPPKKQPPPTKGASIQPTKTVGLPPTKGTFFQPTKTVRRPPSRGSFVQPTQNVDVIPSPSQQDVSGAPPLKQLNTPTRQFIFSNPFGQTDNPNPFQPPDFSSIIKNITTAIGGFGQQFFPTQTPSAAPVSPPSKNYFASDSNDSPTIIAPHTPGAQCGLRNTVERPSYLDRDDVAFGEIPWQAMILSTTDRKLLCSGAIVSPNVVLTAAHCVYGLRPEEVSIKSGEWKLGSEIQQEEPLPFEIVKVQNIVSHPGYSTGSSSHDLAMLFLVHPMHLEQHVDTICLGNIPQPTIGRKCIATGWGKVVLQVHAAGSLMHGIDVDIVPQDECRQRVQGAESPVEIDNTLTCVKAHKERNNMCQVDVGGPLACDRGDGIYELTGVYSYDTGCLPTNQVATYALIDTNWVKKMLASPPSPTFEQQVQQPAPVCDCQKSYLPPSLNQYLPPV
ncbi:filaggrin-2-like [Diprion similis]|uniref:filaggrin-2-like n=1 Tax=Diprion similis TaxID=362088 RepID=UPI001EF98C02|nr:filaggrin-2-like [Diprion similis]